MSDVFEIRKVTKLSAEAQTAASLREGIVSGEIPPATRLTEIRMAEQLGVSRATIRTAFHQLAQEGLMVQTPYTGWAVMSLDSRDAWELYTLRSSLEALAARLVANRHRDQNARAHIATQLDEAFAGLTLACKSGDRSRIANADFSLHRTIIELSEHRRLIGQYANLEQQVRMYIASSDALIADPAVIIEQHEPIIEALKAGKAQQAVRESIAHNEEEGAKLEAFIREREGV